MLYDVKTIMVQNPGGTSFWAGDYFKDFVVMKDYIEECDNLKDLIRIVNEYSTHDTWEISMDGKYKTRLKAVDVFGNVRYFSIRKIQ